MIDAVTHFFGWVCGQNPEHTWSPGGLLLPCCQRCTGLYVGAFIAAGLHVWLRPRLSGGFLEVHGVLLLPMVPFGFHWVAQGPWLRTVTGVLFGFGVVTFLWLRTGARAFPPAATPPRHEPANRVAGTSKSTSLARNRRGARRFWWDRWSADILVRQPRGTRTRRQECRRSDLVAAWRRCAVSRVSKRADHATRDTAPTWKPAILAPWSRGNSNSTGASEPTTPRGEQVEKPALRGGLPRATVVYFLGVVLTTALLPAIARFGDAKAAILLTGLASGGLLALTALVLANAVRGLRGCARSLRPLLARAGT